MDDSMKSRTDIGVLVGRFQVPDLHEGHRELIEKVAAWHKKFLVVLGCSPTPVTRRNPLDFQARKVMINAHYPEIPVVPLMDCADDDEWSKQLDRRVREVSRRVGHALRRARQLYSLLSWPVPLSGSGALVVPGILGQLGAQERVTRSAE